MAPYEVRLNEIANVQLGYQSRERIEEDLGGIYAIIRPQDFNDEGQLLLGGSMRFSPKIDPKKYLVCAGDILVQARGQYHCAYLLEERIYNTVASNSFYIVRIHNQNNLTPTYLTWWLNLPNVQDNFKQERGVSTIPFITIAVLQKTSIRVPSMETQEIISKLMQLWQREQKLNEQLIKMKELLIQEVCRKATLS